MTISLNFQNGETVSSPTTIVTGSTNIVDRGVVTFTNNNSEVFPPLSVEVNNGQFKALVNVSPDEPNLFRYEVASNGFINNAGIPEYQNGKPEVLDSGEITLYYNPLPNKPIHLCLIVARDSPGTYDVPQYKLQQGHIPSVQSAISKLKVAGRLMQAFTQDDMRGHGFHNRGFPFVEEQQTNMALFGFPLYDSPKPHMEVRVHVLKSSKTVAELRDVEMAQQNPNAKDSGGLFSHALDLIRGDNNLGGVIRSSGTAIQCAVIYLDSTYDRQRDMILAHAALGGGNNEVKLAIFGSHGLHSWPDSFPGVTPAFLDSTELSKREVANDANQCGTSWECFNITLGAFMHEIGHLLGSPHQINGVMLRDYIWWNRSFMTRETKCLREKTNGALINPNGVWNRLCRWNILDLIRYLFHGSFGLPIDTYEKTVTTTTQPDNSYSSSEPTFYQTRNGEIVVKGTGIFAVELVADDLARYHTAFYPREYGGSGLQDSVTLNYQDCYQNIRSQYLQSKPDFQVRVLATSGELFINNLKDATNISSNMIVTPRLRMHVIKGHLLGRQNSDNEFIAEFDLNLVSRVRVYYGMSLDGMRFEMRSSQEKEVDNSFWSKVRGSLPNSNELVLAGQETGSYADFTVPQGEKIVKLHIRNGAWIDAVQFETDRGTKSPMYGGNGGHLSTLEVPDQKTSFAGLYGYNGQWIDGIGMLYSSS